MLKIHVDNLKVFVQPNTTILEACELVGVEIPRFCYYEKLSIAGNCRMCLVEVEKSPKPVVSCAMPVMVGMKIFTNTPLVKKAREGVLEFLLLNHPLDCPICDQGGECDLQDQAIAFGSDRSRFYDFKRTTEDKNVGPILKTIMTRCIHCTRCVRFASEIAGLGDLGTTARGTHTEIGTYIEKVFQSELSGNVIDLCPVGALTSKPYAFIARPWELKTVDSIDISDAIGSNIRIDYKETEIVRVLPRLNEELNEEWISNKTRFLYDGLKHQRLIYPYVSYSLEGTFFAKSWVESLEIFQKKLQGQMFCFGFTSPTKGKIVAICGVNIDLETLLSFKNFMHRLGSENISFERDLRVESDYSFNYRLNSNETQIENADFCLLIGVNPRYEGSLLNVRLRKRFMDGRFQVASLGAVTNLTYPVNHIGLGTQQLYKTFFSDYVTSLGKLFFEAKAPIIIFGSSILERKDSLELQKLFVSLNPNVTLNLLQTDSNQTGAFELGIQPVSRIKVRDYMIRYL
jgi:NADH-quinone oxidoreductase chain G